MREPCAPAAGLHADPLDPALRAGGLAQLRREHLLAWLLPRHDGYDEGCFVLLVPGLNDGWVAAGRAYERSLAPAGARAGAGAGTSVPFGLVTLEEAVAAAPGGEGPAAYLAERHLAFGRVHRLVLGDDLPDLPPLPGSGRGDAAARVGSPGPLTGA